VRTSVIVKAATIAHPPTFEVDITHPFLVEIVNL
jgi:hypothetical protein